MARRLQKRGVRLDRLISSSAQRAKETASFFVGELEIPPESFVLEPALYGATAVDWLRLIQGLDESLDSVMMIGHNPTLTELANGLGRIDIMNIPTCGILECRFSGDYWGNFGDQLSELEIGFDFPKNAENLGSLAFPRPFGVGQKAVIPFSQRDVPMARRGSPDSERIVSVSARPSAFRS